MYSKNFGSTARHRLGLVITAALIFLGSAAAKDHNVTIALRVNSAGLDLNKAADAQVFYSRLRKAAWVVCTRGTRVDLAPAEDEKGCIDKALSDAVRFVKLPMVTQVYTANHTIKGAAAGWSYVPVPEGAK